MSSSDRPALGPDLDEVILTNKIGFIACELARRLGIPPEEALQRFYQSRTCAQLHDKSTGLYRYGDLYLVDEYMQESNNESL